jgi:hypothetical protein
LALSSRDRREKATKPATIVAAPDTGAVADMPAGSPVEEALQSAQKTLIGAEGTRHPFFWAGFIAVRGPQ